MKNINDLNKKKVPVVRIDNSLEQYKDRPMFQYKVDKANEMLKNGWITKIKKSPQLTLSHGGLPTGRQAATSTTHTDIYQ